MEGYLKIVVSCTLIYLFLIIAIRLFGKKELAQLSIVDLIFILLISNAVQNAMVGTDSSLTGGLVAAASLFAINYVLKYLLYKFPKLEGMIEGTELLLIYKGQINERNIAKAHISHKELLEAIREHGASEIREVDLAMLEIDGNISIISNDFRQRSIKKRKGHSKVTKNE